MNKLLILGLLAISIISRCPQDERCLDCDGNICILCFRGYPDNEGICRTGTIIGNCRFYSSNGVCSSCDFGYYLSDNECKEIEIDRCAVVDSQNPDVCIACEDRRLVTEGACDDIDRTCADDNCEVCNAANACIRCKRDFSVTSNFECVVAPVEGCLSVGTNANTCDTCRPGFFNTVNGCAESEIESTTIVRFISVFILMIFAWF